MTPTHTIDAPLYFYQQPFIAISSLYRYTFWHPNKMAIRLFQEDGSKVGENKLDSTEKGVFIGNKL